MADLPARPSLDHLRREARDLLRAAQSGDTAAADRIRAVSATPTLASAQLALAREYGFASWARLKTAVEARTTDLARQADVFCEASIRDWTGRAVRMLAATPELAGYNFATAVILGDADRVRAEIARDPGLATRVDARTGWTPLHAACASNWHQLDPARADGLLAVARLLLDAGSRSRRPVRRAARRGGWTPLRCAVAGAANPPVVALLLERGAVPDDHDLYLAGFGGDDHQSLRLMLGHATDVAGIAEMALAAPLSHERHRGGTAAAGGRRRSPPLRRRRRRARLGGLRSRPVRLFGRTGSTCCSPTAPSPDRPGPDGRSPYTLAILQGRADLADLLRRHGAVDDSTDTDRFLAALPARRPGRRDRSSWPRTPACRIGSARPSRPPR